MTNAHPDVYSKLESSENKRMDSLFRFYRTITTLSVGLLGLLIGLKPAEPLQEDPKLYFLSGLSLLVASILFSLIVQYYETILLNRESNVYLKEINNTQTQQSGRASKTVRVNTGWIYQAVQILTCVCLALSLISLTYYAYLTF
jgi:hypothetical protein